MVEGARCKRSGLPVYRRAELRGGAMSYYDKIYGLVRRIPAGKCASYGQLALLSGSPRAARVVGSALRLCKEDAVPCHRVLRSDGSVTCAFPPGLQRALLEAEGVAFTPSGKVDWSQCGWDGT